MLTRGNAASTAGLYVPQLSMGCVDPWVGLDWVHLGRDFSVFGGLGPLQQMYYNFEMIMFIHSKHELDKIWLRQAVKFVSCIELGPNFSTCNGLG